MARYIDANELQKAFEKIADEPDYMHEGDTWETGIYLAGTIIDKQPTADVVEVVRCKDCAYYVPLGDNYEYKGKKAMHCILRASCTGDNYYCADGIRKEKDND